jgi:hypothetical protein
MRDYKVKLTLFLGGEYTIQASNKAEAMSMAEGFFGKEMEEIDVQIHSKTPGVAVRLRHEYHGSSAERI